MTLQEVIGKIRSDKNHTKEDIKVATLLFNLGLTYIFSGKQIRKESNIIGEIDLCFFDDNEKILFIIEVAKQKGSTSQKIDHFFSKWSDKENLKLLKSLYKLIPNKIYKINFDLFKRKDEEDFKNKPSLNHIINQENILIGSNDFEYFEKTFHLIGKWARNDFYNLLAIGSDAGYTNIPGIAFKTGNERAFVYADSVSNILRYAYISRRRDNENGYQRMVEEGRIGSILKTIKKGNTITFPNSIILNSNTTLFDDKIDLDNGPKPVNIKIPNGYCQFRVIDGQHRLMGFSKMGDFNRNEYSLPIVILEKIAKTKEIQTFIEINHKQKKLDSNLILTLKADFNWKVEDKEYFEKISVLISRELNKNSELKNNIFFGYADEKKGQKITVTTLHSAIKKNNFIGAKNHLFQTDVTDHIKPYNKIKSILSLIAKTFKTEKEFFFTNVGLRILFRYVQIFEKNFLKGLIRKSLEDNLTDLKNAFPKDTIIDSIKEQYGEGGANTAVEILYSKLKSQNKEYKEFEIDLRKL